MGRRMSSDETILPQVGRNPTAATLPVESRVSGANGSTDSGGSHSLDMSQVQSGKSNARGDNPVSKTRKTSKRQARKRGVQGDDLPLLQVNSSPLQRSKSQSSLLSVQSTGSYGSAVSAFSNASADAVKALKSHWEKIAELRLKQERNINDIKIELQAMTDSCNVQKNVNMTIKEAFQKIRQLVDAIDRDH